jgi:hypothetical protein
MTREHFFNLKSATIPHYPGGGLNACHVGRSLSPRVAMVVVVAIQVIEHRDCLELTSMLRKTRFVLACPLLVIGVAVVLLGRCVLTPDDRREFDKHYFGQP